MGFLRFEVQVCDLKNVEGRDAPFHLFVFFCFSSWLTYVSPLFPMEFYQYEIAGVQGPFHKSHSDLGFTRFKTHVTKLSRIGSNHLS